MNAVNKLTPVIERPDFVPFGKIARLRRMMVVTEKLDGTNASVHVTETGEVYAASRTRWITPEDDNYGFAKWVHDHAEELLQLGPGAHFGEWWGRGIQRGYGLQEKRFSLFNTSRWADPIMRPACCHCVPVLYYGRFNTAEVECITAELESSGSSAAPGFMKPEGVMVYHMAGNFYLKRTIEKDDEPKWQHPPRVTEADRQALADIEAEVKRIGSVVDATEVD